jgi:iron complex outermembrane recepter protein
MHATLTPWQRPVRSHSLSAHVASSSGGFAARIIAAALIALCFAGSLAAQGTGTIDGRVFNRLSERYVVNARVTVVGTPQSVLTNEYGEYRISGLPAGSVTLQVSYTGLDTETAEVNVTAGSIVTRNFNLTDRAITGDDETIVLDVFTVQASRETNAALIAINEQRNSPNLKNVVAADAFGDVTEGNVGEFMKFLPGVTVDYVAADVRTMSVRGFADNFTTISVNGSQMASAASGSNTRSFEFEQVSINNVSRVELVKSPRPQDPASSLGGSVNLISKNAFERASAEFKYRAYLSLNTEKLSLSKSPGPMDKPTIKVLPGFDFDYTIPVSRTLGFVITGLTSNQFNPQKRSQTQWNHAQVGATPSNPYLQTVQFQDGPKNTFRDSLSIRSDWKFAPEHVLSASFQTNYYKSQFGNRNVTFETNTSSTTAGDMTWGADSVTGRSGGGRVRTNSSFRDKMGATSAGNIEWNYNGNLWKARANAALSRSRTWYRDTGNGHFNSSEAILLGTRRVDYSNIDDETLDIAIYDASGNLIDWTDSVNFNINNVRENWLDSNDWVTTYDAELRRELDFLSFPASLKIGYAYLEKERDTRRYDQTWSYTGINGSRLRSDFTDDYIASVPWNQPKFEFYDPYALYDAFLANPSAFTQSTTANGQLVAFERFKKQNSYRLIEQINAYYAQLEASLFDGRLGVLTGFRIEESTNQGWGVLTTGPATTLAEVAANMVDRGYYTKVKYDDIYPSVHLTYNVTDDFLLRFSYAKTLGRPDYSTILPLARINYDEDDVISDGSNINPQTVIVNNIALKPWTGDGYDFSAQYYMKDGYISAGYFLKEIADFWGTDNRTVTQADIDLLGLPSDTLGFIYSSRKNIGDAKIQGFEFDFRHHLGLLGDFGRSFTVFGNATKLNLDGPFEADFARFIESSGNLGVDYSRKPFKISLKANYRGLQRLAPQTGGQYGSANQFREYYAPRTFIDANIEYTLSKRYIIFANARNITNKDQVLRRYNSDTPDYARTYRTENFGVQIAIGVKGSF